MDAGTDAGASDAGLADAGQPDAGPEDAGAGDGGPDDAGLADAGMVVPDAGAVPGCTTHAACTRASELCVAGQCRSGLGRRYYFLVNRVTAPASPGSGGSWDAFGGDPDLKVCANADSVQLGCSSTFTDTTAANIGWGFWATVSSSTSVQVMLYDEDVNSNDFIGSFTWTASDVISHARSGRLSRSSGGLTWDVSISW